MMCWEVANGAERRQFQAISILMRSSPHLLAFLFDPVRPSLSGSPQDILAAARGFCSGDRLLVRLAVEIWCAEGAVNVHEIFDAEPEVFDSILEALRVLAPQPSALGRLLVQGLGVGSDVMASLNSRGVKADLP